MKIEKVKNQPIIDKLGQILAVICAVHCAVFPFLIPVLAVLPFASSVFETALMSGAFLMASISLVHAIKHKKNPAIVVLFLFGFSLFIAHLLTKSNHNHGFDFVTMMASALLGAGHLMNKRCGSNCSN